MKLKILGLVLLAIPILYVAQVPTLRFISSFTGPSQQEYPPIAAHLETETFEMSLIFPGITYDFWFDVTEQQFVGLSMDIESGVEYVVTFDLQGNLIAKQPIVSGEYKRFQDTTRYSPITLQPDLNFGDSYDLRALGGLINLAHFQFEDFTWPYMFYFIPVIRFDWAGTGFIEISVDGETLKFSIPTNLKSQWAYLDAVVEAEIYMFQPEATQSDILFVQIKETSYLSGYGGDIHRDGIGFYVVRRKQP